MSREILFEYNNRFAIVLSIEDTLIFYRVIRHLCYMNSFPSTKISNIIVSAKGTQDEICLIHAMFTPIGNEWSERLQMILVYSRCRIFQVTIAFISAVSPQCIIYFFSLIKYPHFHER